MDKKTFAVCLGVVDAEKQKLLTAINGLKAQGQTDESSGVVLLQGQFAEADLIGFLLQKQFDAS